jgi:serine/threonine protein kinase
MGRPPFMANESLELIHLHLAKKPPRLMPPPARLASCSPTLRALLQAMESIVHKMLQKQPEDRYQTANGMLYDLRAVLKMVNVLLLQTTLDYASQKANQTTHPPTPDPNEALNLLQNFQVGRIDRQSFFALGGKLYGREHELEALKNAYEHAHTMHLRGNHTLAGDHTLEPQIVLVSGWCGMG